MPRNMITTDELAQFKSLAVKKKVDSMEMYLIGRNGYKYNMQEVGVNVFGDENYSYTVSLIHRCYNFSGQNGGKYRNGCKFEQTYGYRVSRKDIEAFVKKYPNGTFSNGVTFDDFLRSRVNSISTQRQLAQRQPIHGQVRQQQYNYENRGYFGNNQMNDAQLKALMIGFGSILALIFLIMVVTGFFFRHWIIGIIVALMMVGVFGAIKEM
ncbi:hypothetical protein [Faecalimonas sp.]